MTHLTRRDDRGMVTAELMMIAPLGVAFAFLLLWVVSLGLTQVRVVDASREAARMIARGESPDMAQQIAQRYSPPGAKVRISREGGTVSVTVEVGSRMPIPFFAGVGSRELESTSVAAQEAP